tara:strand:+ start:139 stop:327 length:189 start_codon:yes stop_codon:yes gene_type:complete
LKTHSVMTHSQLKVDYLRIRHWLKLRRPLNPANREKDRQVKDRQVRDHLARGKDRQVKGNRA